MAYDGWGCARWYLDPPWRKVPTYVVTFCAMRFEYGAGMAFVLRVRLGGGPMSSPEVRVAEAVCYSFVGMPVG